MDAILYWNFVALQTVAQDYDAFVTPVPDQDGPLRVSRVYAIIHGAMYDAVAVFDSQVQPVFAVNNLVDANISPSAAAMPAAIMEAAYQTLYYFYPAQRVIFNAIRDDFLMRILEPSISSDDLQRGIDVGTSIASFIIKQRRNDGSSNSVTYTPRFLPGYHEVDPLNPDQGFLVPQWGNVTPFFIDSGSQFRAPDFVGINPTSRLLYLNSTQYLTEFDEVKSLGERQSTTRTADQEEIGIFWAYDGAPRIGTPPRLYNQVARVIAMQTGNTLRQNARLFALLNYAMADAGIATWESKYFYEFWRPIVAIRQATSPAERDPSWEPLGSPSDGVGRDFTPNFPAYTSGHAGFGSASFETLRRFYGTDSIRFRFQSDEYNGNTVDSRTQQPRPARFREYTSFTQAETENTLARIYLGIHWRSDQTEGELLGRRVAELVFNRFNART